MTTTAAQLPSGRLEVDWQRQRHQGARGGEVAPREAFKVRPATRR